MRRRILVALIGVQLFFALVMYSFISGQPPANNVSQNSNSKERPVLSGCQRPASEQPFWAGLPTVTYDPRHETPAFPKGMTEFPDVVILKSRIPKNPNGPIFSADSVFENNANEEYRVMRLDWQNDYSEIREGEAVESDACIVIFANEVHKISLSSGEEVLCSHESYAGGVPIPKKEIILPAGGLPVPAGGSFHFNGVSNIFFDDLSRPPHVPKDEQRRKDNLFFMALSFEAVLVKASVLAGRPNSRPLISQRSPFRDRSATTFPGYFYLPYTNWRNPSKTEPVDVPACGVFLSAIERSVPVEYSLVALVDDQVVFRHALPPHTPSRSNEQSSNLFSLNIRLHPGQTLSLRISAVTTVTSVVDGAAFILATHQLEKVDEMTLPGIDISGDGEPELMDLDDMGSLWSDWSRDGHHDTQHIWVDYLPPAREVKSFELNGGNTMEDPWATIKAKNGQCLRLFRDYERTVVTRHCVERVPPALKNPTHWMYRTVHADFNGDGFHDRVRADGEKLFISLGSERGLVEESLWTRIPSGVHRLFVAVNPQFPRVLLSVQDQKSRLLVLMYSA